MTGILIGDARCSTDEQDLETNRQILLGLGVPADQIYLDRPYSGPARQAHLVELHTAGEHTIADLVELFEVSRPTVYRVLERACAATATADAA